MITNRILPALSLLVLGGISLLGLILLAALGHPIPEVLPTLATVSLSALAGVAVPALAITSGPSSSTPASSSTPPSWPAIAAAEPAGPIGLVASQAPATADVNPAAGGSGFHIAGGVPTAA